MHTRSNRSFPRATVGVPGVVPFPRTELQTNAVFERQERLTDRCLRNARRLRDGESAFRSG
jgi:hypothetical protein